MPKRPLGRREPPNYEHVDAYPLAAVPKRALVEAGPTPCVLGIPWYERFDTPVRDSGGRYWAAKAGDALGAVRGGHAICVKPGPLRDLATWRRYYNQRMTSECVGYSASRMMSLLNRKRYKAEWLYMRATERDPWPGNNLDPNSGTDVNSAMSVLKELGHLSYFAYTPRVEEGIAAYRWATSVQEIFDIIQTPTAERLEAIPLTNSWGEDGWPNIAWLPASIMTRLFDEGGECVTVTDR